MVYGLMIVTDLKELGDSERRLFRKKRQQLMKKINLKRIKNGVYFFPFENPEPSKSEIEDFGKFQDLMSQFRMEVKYFTATEVEVSDILDISGNIFEGGEIHPERIKSRFIVKPIEIEH